jgi:hypothetical protein
MPALASETVEAKKVLESYIQMVIQRVFKLFGLTFT